MSVISGRWEEGPREESWGLLGQLAWSAEHGKDRDAVPNKVDGDAGHLRMSSDLSTHT